MTAHRHCHERSSWRCAVQDDASNPSMPFAVGFTLERLSAHTVGEDGQPAFVTNNPMDLLRKASMVPCRLESIPSCEPDVATARAAQRWQCCRRGPGGMTRLFVYTWTSTHI